MYILYGLGNQTKANNQIALRSYSSSLLSSEWSISDLDKPSVFGFTSPSLCRFAISSGSRTWSAKILFILASD